MARHRSSAAPLAALYAALIVYASLYPFTGWHEPGVSPFAFLTLPWPRWWTGFDLVSNLVGYAPLGALVFGARVRTGTPPHAAFVRAVAFGAVLSLAMETLQNYLPQRVSSNVDLGLNIAGTLCGAALGGFVHARGWIERWQVARDRWFIRQSAGGIALLLLWPVGLLFPTTVPLGLGQVMDHAREALAVLVDGTSAAPWLEPWLDPDVASLGLTPLGEFAVVMFGLLAPCLMGFTVAHPGWRRLVLVAGAAALGLAATTLSTALNFGPEHALAWNTPWSLTAVGVAAFIAALLAPVPRRVAAGLGLMALTALVVLVSGAPGDPYFADSLQGWEQGRFIRFHGAAQWVGWFWPYASIAYLLARMAARPERPRERAAPIDAAPARNGHSDKDSDAEDGEARGGADPVAPPPAAT